MKCKSIIVKLLLAIPLFLFFPNLSQAATETIKIYPTDDVLQQLYDNDGQNIWSSARSYTGTFARSINSTSTIIAARSDAGTGSYRIYRVSLLFDTSIIPDGAVIQSATFNLHQLIYGNNTPLVFTEHSRASTTNFVSSDWQLTHYGAEISRGTLNVDQYTAQSLNAIGLGYIDTSGYTDIGVMTAFDYDNIDPGNTISGAAFASSEAGTSTSPYLEVTYTVPDAVVTLQALKDAIDNSGANKETNKELKKLAGKIFSALDSGQFSKARESIAEFRKLMKEKKVASPVLNSLLTQLESQLPSKTEKEEKGDK